MKPGKTLRVTRHYCVTLSLASLVEVVEEMVIILSLLHLYVKCLDALPVKYRKALGLLFLVFFFHLTSATHLHILNRGIMPSPLLRKVNVFLLK